MYIADGRRQDFSMNMRSEWHSFLVVSREFAGWIEEYGYGASTEGGAANDWDGIVFP